MVADVSALYLIRVGDRTFVRRGQPAAVARGMRATKHLPGGHDQRTHGRQRPGGNFTEHEPSPSGVGQLEIRGGTNALDGLRGGIPSTWKRKSDMARYDMADMALDAIRGGRGTGYTILDRGELVGIASVNFDGDTVHVQELATKRRGYGGKMMQYIARDAVAQNKPVTLLSVPDALGFYKKLGFKPDPDDPDDEFSLLLPQESAKALARGRK